MDILIIEAQIIISGQDKVIVRQNMLPESYKTNAMLWIDDDNGITRYTRCNVFKKLLIYALCVITARRFAPNAVLVTRMTGNVTFKTT